MLKRQLTLCFCIVRNFPAFSSIGNACTDIVIKQNLFLGPQPCVSSVSAYQVTSCKNSSAILTPEVIKSLPDLPPPRESQSLVTFQELPNLSQIYRLCCSAQSKNIFLPFDVASPLERAGCVCLVLVFMLRYKIYSKKYS